MKLKLILMCAIVALSPCLFACTKAVEDADAIEDTTWVLESYGEQGNLQAVLEGTEITATFQSAEGQVNGSAGCNSYFGGYQIDENKLSVPMMAHTEMYCVEPEGAMEQETQYLRLLSAAESYEVTEDKLQIIAGSQVLVFNAKNTGFIWYPQLNYANLFFASTSAYTAKISPK
ncbi:META domain-containing protein [Chloroflexota bacterium]